MTVSILLSANPELSQLTSYLSVWRGLVRVLVCWILGLGRRGFDGWFRLGFTSVAFH